MKNIITRLFKKELTEYKGFKLYDIVQTCNGVGVIIKFKKAHDRSEEEYIGALIRYTKPYISFSFQEIQNITKEIINH